MHNSDSHHRPDDALQNLAADITSALDRIAPTSLDEDEKIEASSASNDVQTAVQPSSTNSSSPSATFATPQSGASPEMKITPLDSIDPERKSASTTATTKGSHGKRPSIIGRPRSGSGFSMLAKLTSRGSSSNIHRASQSIDSTITTSNDPSRSPVKPKLDKAALSRQTSKYKSGINLENSDFLIGRTEEPYAASSSPVEERTQNQLRQAENDAVLRELASAGGTKALLAQANDAGSIGIPYFPSAQRAALEVSAQAQAQAFRPTNHNRTPISDDQSTAAIGSAAPHTSPTMIGVNGSEGANKMTSEAAQQFLQNARDAVAMSNAAIARNTSPPMAAANATSVEDGSADVEAKVDDTEASRPALTTSKSRKRMSFMGFGVGSGSKSTGDETPSSSLSIMKKSKGKKGKATTLDVVDANASEFDRQLMSSSGGPASAKTPSSDGTTTPGGTVSRRRFRDTRELGLVASQLAAEALMPPSMPNGSYTDTSSSSVLMAPPVPAFANEGRSNSNASSLHGSPMSGSPRMASMPDHASRFDASRAAFAARTSQSASPSSPFATQSANISGLPSDMLTGLSDGPYPALPPRSMDFTDPFSAPGSLLDHGASSIRSGASSGRNSVPNIGVNERRSRGLSAGSTQTWAGQAMGPRRSVMQMSMHNPEQELQGLTKPAKSARSTPFGSRAPSRQVTPRSSTTNLREANKEANSSGNDKSVVVGDANVGENGKSKSKNRLSMFKKNRSTTELAPSQLHPPLPDGSANNVNRFSSQSKVSTSNDSVTSNRNSENTALTTADGEQTSITNPSANSLVKMPSPSMTSTSGSSHDRSFNAASSSDGDNNTHNATSAMTTPEVAPSKMELTNPSPTTLPASRTTVSPMTSIAAPAQHPATVLTAAQPFAAPTMPPSLSRVVAGINDAKVQQVPVTTTPPPMPVSQTASQPTSRLGKFTSRFATKSSTNLHEMAASTTASWNGRTADATASNGMASKSQSNLPIFKKRDGSKGMIGSTSPGNSKFDTFRASIKRDWFV